MTEPEQPGILSYENPTTIELRRYRINCSLFILALFCDLLFGLLILSATRGQSIESRFFIPIVGAGGCVLLVILSLLEFVETLKLCFMRGVALKSILVSLLIFFFLIASTIAVGYVSVKVKF